MIDTITYNDLNIDDLYKKINTCKTSCGDDYLISRILDPYDGNREEFISLVNNINNFNADKSLNNVGKLKKYTFNECLERLLNANVSSNIIHYISGLLVILSFALIFAFPGMGLLCVFASIAFSLYLYFKEQKIKNYELYAYSYISRLAKEFKYIKIVDINDAVANKLISEGNDIVKELKQLTTFSFLIKTNPGTDGNPIDVLLDYIRMIFHVDLIKYNNVLNCIKSNEEHIRRLYIIYGMFDASICIRQYRDSLSFYSVPEFISEKKLIIEDCYHPLIENPVLNSLDTTSGVLLTGSNASGKSTFLKTIALCIIFSQSFGFLFSRSATLKKCSVYTSMALRDDISKGESYFIKEIKSLKRIVDAVKSDEFVICFVDEVLRGTNTIERIAAAKEILFNIEADNSLVFAATHDLELSTLLCNKYINYHFTEIIKENDVVFPYTLCEGATKTRNAIKLLSLMGYDKETVDNAESLAHRFIENGVWD